MKIFKLCKILRLVKASRYLSGIANFGKVIQKEKKQILTSIIAIIATGFEDMIAEQAGEKLKTADVI